jgi:hypothetical protein
MGACPTVDPEYDGALRAAGVAAEHWPDYRKWLRFYPRHAPDLPPAPLCD